MNRSEPTGCRWSDDVLARHLDGALADDAADQALDEHLQACGRCQQALRRARRLDAVLAQESGEFQHERLRTDELEARWFAAVAAAAHGAPTAAARATPVGFARLRRWLAIAAAAALLGWFALRSARVGAPSAGADPHGHLPAPVASAGSVPSVGNAPSSESPSSGFPSSGFPPSGFPPSGSPFNGSPSSGSPVPGSPGFEARSVAIDLRQLEHWGAADRASHTSAPAPAVNLASVDERTAPNPTALRDLIARLQDRDSSVLEPSFLRRALACNHPDVDEALRRRMRRHPGSLGLVAAAARETAARGSTARLLLDLWEDSAVRSSGTDDGALAQQLFSGQSAATFRELGQLASTRGHVVRQHRCWLGLGWSHDLDPTTELLAAVHGSSHEASVAAAFALSCQPWPRLLPLARAADAPNGFLVRAALWRNGAPELACALADRSLAPELLSQLRACSLATFTELVDGLRHGAAGLAE